MRGFLKSREGVFLLSTKSTTIGREGCDLVLPTATGECIHATIDYIEEDFCFMLQDLNSIQGVYVNDCCIRKTAVQLVPNDILCFGYNGIPYEFLVESKQTQHKSTSQDARTNQCIKPKSNRFTYRTGLVQLISSFTPTVHDLLCDKKQDENNTDDTQELSDGAGWISGPRKIAMEQCHEVDLTDDNSDITSLRHQMNCLQCEVKRLSVFEAENDRKDDLIEQLREEITNLQNFVRLIEVDRCPYCQKETLSGSGRLLQLEAPQSTEHVTLDNVTESTSSQVNEDTNVPESSTSGVVSSVKSVKSSHASQASQLQLHAELDRTRDDCNLSIALACQMQRDMINKDVTISRMAKEIDALKQTQMDQEMHIAALEENLQKLDGGDQLEEADIIAKDREIALLRYKLNNSEANKAERLAQITSLTDELTKCKAALDADTQSEKKLRAELESLKVKNQDLERAERVARIDVEQLSKRFEKLRSRAVQTTFAGTKMPDKLISDDDLIAMMKKCADDRADMQKKSTSDGGSVKESKKK